MRAIRTIFIKQAKDMINNPIALLPFVIFPVVALVMTLLIARGNDDIPNNLFVTMMAAIFAGFGLLQSSAAIISEDIEKKSLRFLVMAGVEPHEYLIGIGGFLLIAGALVSLAFALIGELGGIELVKFLVIMITSCTASIILGATIGMISKNQQAAAALSVPIAAVLGFTPMVAAFNETVEKVAGVLYTQQLNVIANDLSANFTHALLVILANVVILGILFAIAYRKRGLKG